MTDDYWCVCDVSPARGLPMYRPSSIGLGYPKCSHWRRSYIRYIVGIDSARVFPGGEFYFIVPNWSKILKM